MTTQTRRKNAAGRPGNGPPLAAVPQFRQPAAAAEVTDLPGPPAEEDMPLIEERTTGATLPNRPGLGDFSPPYAGVGDEGTIRTRMGTSSETPPRSKAETVRTAAAVIGAAIGVVGMLAGIVAARAFGRMLRQPTPDQRREIARPLAAIAQRRLDLTKWSPDLVDGTAAAEAFGAYLSDGPVAPRLARVEHIGMEHHDEQTAAADNPEPVTPAAPSAAQVWHDATSLNMQPTALNTDEDRPKVVYAQ